MSYILLALGWVGVCVLIVWLEWDQPVGIFLRIACALAAWAFCWRFSRVAWRSTEEGRHIMGYTLITGIFMSLASAVTLFGRFRGIDVLTTALYGWLLALLWQRHQLFTAGQAEVHRLNNRGGTSDDIHP